MPLDLQGIQQNGLGTSLPQNIGDLITQSNIIGYIFGAAGIVLLIYLVLGGFQLMASQGEPKAMQGAQGKITNALIGFVIIAVAYAVVQIISKLLGLQNTAFGSIFK